METIVVIVIGVALFVAFRQGRDDGLPSLADALKAPEAPIDLSQGSIRVSPMELEGDGTFGFSEVSGLSVYRQNLKSLIEDSHPEDIDAGAIECDAILVAEPSNRHDPEAIAVVLGIERHQSQHVGYISRSAQAAIHSLLREARSANFDSLSCAARVSWQGDYRRAACTISLDIVDDIIEDV